MRVLIIRHGLFPGFVTPDAKEYAKNLCRLGIDTTLVIIGNRAPRSEGESYTFPVHIIETQKCLEIYQKLKPLVMNADIVHYLPGKGLELLPMVNRKAKYLFDFRSGSVSGHKVHDWLVNLGKRLQPFLIDHVIYIDKGVASSLSPFRKIPISIMPPGYPADLFYPCSPRENNSEKPLLYQGAVRPGRRLDRLIEVLATLPEEYTLSIAGGGLPYDESYLKYLSSLAQHLHCEDRLNLLGGVPQAALRTVIEKSYLCLAYVPILECYQNQLPYKTFDYLACNRPVLATRTRASLKFSESIGNGRILFADDNVNDIVEKILYADEYIHYFYSEKNLRTLAEILKPYSWQYLVEKKLLPIYQSIMV